MTAGTPEPNILTAVDGEGFLCFASTEVGVGDVEGQIRAVVWESQLDVAAPKNVVLFDEHIPSRVLDADDEILRI